MEYKILLNDEEKYRKIQFLKKQRDGLIIGSYRNILADLYTKIKIITETNNIECSVSMLQKYCHTKNQHEKNLIMDYCLDLVQLGYINIEKNEKIEILKELDF